MAAMAAENAFDGSILIPHLRHKTLDIGSQILLEVGLIPHFWQWLSFFFGPQQCFHICYHTINPTVRRQLSGVAATDAMQDKALKFDAVRFGQALVK